MALPDFSMRQLLEAGVHFGHQAHRWNPKMGSYIFGTRNNIHIVDLAQTVPMLHRALQAVSDTVAKGGRILFVGTKRQAQDSIADAAKRSAQYYVNSRWLGGTLTNWKTISASIARLRKLDEMLSSGEAAGYTKKERLTMQRERDKLDRSLGGIKDMVWGDCGYGRRCCCGTIGRSPIWFIQQNCDYHRGIVTVRRGPGG